MRVIRLAVVLAALSAHIQQAAAAPIVFSEGATDQSHFVAGPLNLGTVDVGVNSISGRVGFVAPTDHTDGYLFAVPIGLSVTDVRIEISPTSVQFLQQVILKSGSTGFLDGTTVDQTSGFLGAGDVYVFAGTPLGPEQYSIGSAGLAGGASDIEYTYLITVESADSAAVPEPTSLALLASGAVGLLAYRRRRTDSNGCATV